MTKQTKVLTGVLAGVALGAVAAVVIATNKNDSLKGKIGDWFCDLLNNSKDKISAINNLVKDSITKVNA